MDPGPTQVIQMISSEILNYICKESFSTLFPIHRFTLHRFGGGIHTLVDLISGVSSFKAPWGLRVGARKPSSGYLVESSTQSTGAMPHRLLNRPLGGFQLWLPWQRLPCQPLPAAHRGDSILRGLCGRAVQRGGAEAAALPGTQR